MPSEKGFRDRPVFVVDDDAGVLRSVERLLKVHGFDARTFNSADAFRALPDPDAGLCVVLDIDLNGSSGIELSRQLRASGSLLPVIFMTANETTHVRRSAVAAGCLACLTKPFSSRSLLRAIHRAITLRTKSLAGAGCSTGHPAAGSVVEAARIKRRSQDGKED